MGSDHMILRVFLPCYFLVYMFMGSTFNVINIRNKYGVDAGKVQKSHPIMDLGESYRNVIFGTILVMVILFAIDPSLLSWFVPIPYLDADWLRLSGVALLLISFVVVRISQSHMKSSWRAGLDLAAPPPELITAGAYTWSRNPIYVGLVATAVGLFLVLPNAVSLSIACLTLLLVEVRVRVEEEFLLRSHGERFAEYCRRTPRWLFGGGRAPEE